MTPEPGAPPLPAEYGAIRPGVDEVPPSPVLRGRVGRPSGLGGRGRAGRSGRGAARATLERRPEEGGGGPATARGAEPGGAPSRPRWQRDHQAVIAGTESRRIVRRIDTWTVLKVSVVFYLCVLLVVVIAGVVLWNIAAALGFIHSIDKSIRTLFDYNKFTLHPLAVLAYTLAGGMGLVIVGSVVNVLAAMVYNLIADIAGGVQVVVTEE